MPATTSDADQARDGGSESLTDLLDQLEDRAQDDDAEVSFGDLMDAMQTRSFAPLLLVPGLIAFGPTGAIPGMSLLTGTILFLVAIQIVFGRDHPWLPRKILDVEVSAGRLEKLIEASRKPARFIDGILKHRLDTFTDGWPARAGAIMCALMALTMFPLALVPWGVMAPAVSIVAYSLGLAARDGALVLTSLVMGVAGLGLTGWFLTTL